VVGNQCGNALLAQRGEVVIAVVAGIGGDQRVGLSQRTGLFDHGQQHALLGARAGDVGRDDHLVGAVHRGLRRVALDHTWW
jgi:hypothetical protein